MITAIIHQQPRAQHHLSRIYPARSRKLSITPMGNSTLGMHTGGGSTEGLRQGLQCGEYTVFSAFEIWGFEHRGTKRSPSRKRELGGTIPTKIARRRQQTTIGSGSTEESTRYRHQSQCQEDVEQRRGCSQGGHPHRTSALNTPFQTGERELSVKMNFFIEQDENAINSKGAINRVAKKMRTYFEMGTDGHRFLCFQFGIS